MPKVRYLKIQFSENIFAYQIPHFRAAVIEKTKRESSLFHNHKEEGFLYRYPLIQYKVTRKKASIICLNDGADDIHYLLRNQNMHLRIGKEEHDFQIEDIAMNYFQIQTWQSHFDYSLLNWLPLNQANYTKYESLSNESEQLAMLEKILVGNILSMAKGLDWFVEDKIEIQLTAIKSIKERTFKNKKMMAFNLNFKSNVSLPDFIGLGKGSSVGFGVVKRFYEKAV